MSVAAFETEADPSEVNLANWRNSPFSRWAFRNIRDVLPVADIAGAVDAVAPFRTARRRWRNSGWAAKAASRSALTMCCARPQPMDS
jgi:hypothetical protein